MTEYTIRRGQRTFRARKLETLQQLIRRGYLGPDDVVSVNGGSFVPLRGLDGLDANGESGPWETWGVARAREERRREDEPSTSSETEDEGDALSDFLSTLEDPAGKSRSGSHIARPRHRKSSSDASWIARDEPPSLSDLADIPTELEALSEDSVGSIDDEALPAPIRSPALPQAPEEGESEEKEPPKPPRAGLRLIEPEPETSAKPPVAPLSFGNWVEGKGAGKEGALLQNFGVVDDGIVLRAKNRPKGPNWWRTVALIAVGVVVIAVWHTYVRTIADTAYPTEAELVAKTQGDGPQIPGEVATPAPREATSTTAIDIERRLRSRVSGEIREFANSEELENLMFQELTNLRVNPMTVKVKPIRLQGTGDVGRDRPIEADVSVKLAGVNAEGDVLFSTIHERLVLTWLVIAKYSRQGRVQFGTVTTRFGQPSPYEKVVEGREIQGTGRRPLKDLLLQ